MKSETWNLVRRGDQPDTIDCEKGRMLVCIRYMLQHNGRKSPINIFQEIYPALGLSQGGLKGTPAFVDRTTGFVMMPVNKYGFQKLPANKAEFKDLLGHGRKKVLSWNDGKSIRRTMRLLGMVFPVPKSWERGYLEWLVDIQENGWDWLEDFFKYLDKHVSDSDVLRIVRMIADTAKGAQLSKEHLMIESIQISLTKATRDLNELKSFMEEDR